MSKCVCVQMYVSVCITASWKIYTLKRVGLKTGVDVGWSGWYGGTRLDLSADLPWRHGETLFPV